MATYSIERNDAHSALICRMTGFLTEDEVAAFCADWRTALIAARRDYGTLRILFDNLKGNPVSPETAAAMARATGDLMRGHDRTAILVASNLSRLQAKRTARAGSEVFASEDEALAWLTQPN